MEFDEWESKIFVYNLSDGKILYEKDAKVETKVASLTKIMTVITALESENRPEKVKISREMLAGLDEYVVANLHEGQEVSFSDLVFEAMLPSAADAAQAIAVATGGNIESFVQKMNEKAKNLGLSHTHFSNVIGADEDNYSSAEDMAMLLKYALKNPEFFEAFTSFEKYLPSLDVVVKKTFEKNETFLGGKTGFTYEAGKNLASFAEINDAELVVVDLNEDFNTSFHIEHSQKIYDFYRENYSYHKLLGMGDLIANITVEDSRTKSLEYFADEDVNLFLANDWNFDEIEKKYSGVKKIDNKSEAKAGDTLGKFTVEYHGETLYEKDIVLAQEIEFYPYLLWNIVIGVVIFTTFLVFFRKWRKNRCKRTRG